MNTSSQAGATGALSVSSELASPLPLRKMADYVQLVRPRILVMSAVAVASGFLLASPDGILWESLGYSLAGICCFVAASGIFNQTLEAGPDRAMQRTMNRPVAAGRISETESSVLGICVSLAGFWILSAKVNLTTATLSLVTMLIYVLLYTPLKRVSPLCTTVGAVPGAMPPVLGYLAADAAFNSAIVALFAVFFVWQFPHFLAIGWIYRDEYRRAGLKMLPSFDDQGSRAGWIALVYAIAFVPVSCLPRFTGLAGTGYLAAALILSSGYLFLTIRFFLKRQDDRARQLMTGSLVCLPAILLCLVADYLRLIS